MDEIPIDGYGVPFPPHSQMFHLKFILDALERCEQEQLLPKEPQPQVPWKNKPAGQYERGSGV